MHYRLIWEKHHGIKIPAGYEIHHIDGNRNNNEICNLLCVSLQEHLDIHIKQNDWGAVQAILARMDNRQGISEAASKFQKKKLKDGTHNFQFINSEKRSNISKKTLKERIEKHGVAFLGIENVQENSKNAGKMAAIKNAGFLDTQSHNHGSRYVKNTFWWTNIETGKRLRSSICPGDKWKRGMIK